MRHQVPILPLMLGVVLHSAPTHAQSVGAENPNEAEDSRNHSGVSASVPRPEEDAQPPNPPHAFQQPKIVEECNHEHTHKHEHDDGTIHEHEHEHEHEHVHNDEKVESFGKTLQDAVTIRDSLDTKRTHQPALASLSRAKGDPVIGQVDAALLLDLAALFDKQSQLAIGPSAEYHLNTTEDAKQSTLNAGLTLEWQTLRLLDYPATIIVTGKTTYKRDWIAKTHGASSALMLMPLFRNRGRKDLAQFWRPERLTDLGIGDFYYLPLLGVEYGQVIEAEDDGPEGASIRGVLRIQFGLYPLAKHLDHRLELIADYAFRGDFFDELDGDDNVHPLLKLSANFYLVKSDDADAGIGVDYTKGEDPEKGLIDSEQWKVGLKIKM